MIKANELRIGNLVLGINDIPKKILPNDILEEYQLNIVGEFFLKPIPITEEWLLKLGATKYNGNRFYLDLEKEGTLQLFWNLGDDYFICEFSSRSTHVCYFNDTKYIHQLQNLYFFICGKELMLNID
jgi:hypothetical protein